jgi:hypothetical protein
MNVATDYRPTAEQADMIIALSLMTHDDRMAVLKLYLDGEGVKALAELFSHTIGMANSVVENCREWVEITAIFEGNTYPHDAEKFNLPTMIGAAMGAKLAARVDQDGLCAGCAARHGTVANQCAPTVCDVEWIDTKGGFLCHLEGLDENQNAKKPCIGSVRLMAAKRAEEDPK